MKRLTLILLFALGGLHLSAQSLFTSLSYDEALKYAEILDKPFYVDLTADWCFPCKLMNETVFQDAMVKQYSYDHFIAIQLDVENFDAMILKSQYQVNNLPTVLFFDSKGELLGRSVGLQTGTGFLEILKSYN